MPTSLASSLDTTTLVIGLAGGLAIFLFGMDQMTEAMKKAAGAGLRDLLKKLTTNRFMAVITGALVTAVVQSSSVTTVLVVGFVSAGIMTLAQSVGVIFGANVGTTITAQIVAFDVSAYALLMIALGFGALRLGRSAGVRNVGAALMGLGLIFFGMGLMGEATRPLRTYQPFIDVMQSMDNPLLAMLVAAAFTALVQSSSATTGIVIVLASQGFISLESGIALALGANVGTCVTAILAALGKPAAARQAAAVHVLFNFGGALLWVAFIGPLADIVREVSPSHPELEGVRRMAAEVPRQIANAHTVFNIANTIVFLPFTGVIARLVQRFIPTDDAAEDARRPQHLDPTVLSVPSLAIERIRLEIARMGDRIVEGIRSMKTEDAKPLAPAGFQEAAVDAEALYAATVEYGRKVSMDDAGQKADDELRSLLLAANHFMSITDSVRRHLLSLVRQAQAASIEPSPETRQRLRDLTREVVASLEGVVRALEAADAEAALTVIEQGARIDKHAAELHQHLEDRLVDEAQPTTVERYRFEFALMEVLVRVEYFTQRIAETIAAGTPAARA